MVTLLALVRDAAARLPGGEGSRADVCELLKESQYVIDGVNDVQISQVASGALPHISPTSRLYLAHLLRVGGEEDGAHAVLRQVRRHRIHVPGHA